MKRCLLRCALATAIIVFVALLLRRPLLTAVGSWLDVGEAPRRVDYIVLLPGDERTRGFVVAGLVTKGYANAAILIPAKLYLSEKSVGLRNKHEVGRDILQAQGLTDEQIIQLPDFENASTFADAESVERFLDSQPASCQIAVVTNDYHTRRARWAFRQVLQQRMRQVRFFSAPADYHSAETWWHSTRGMEAYLSEYFKLSYYMLRYNRQNRIWLLVTVVIVAGVFASGWLWCRRCSQADHKPPGSREN